MTVDKRATTCQLLQSKVADHWVKVRGGHRETTRLPTGFWLSSVFEGDNGRNSNLGLEEISTDLLNWAYCDFKTSKQKWMLQKLVANPYYTRKCDGTEISGHHNFASASTVYLWFQGEGDWLQAEFGLQLSWWAVVSWLQLLPPWNQE